jgi:predicted nucleotidyltransferase
VAIREPEKLLAEWAENYSFRKNRVRDCYSLEPIPDLEAGLAEACRERKMQYALTGFSAAARLAPMVRSPRAMAYVEKPLDEMIASLGLKEVTSGANVTLMEPYDAGVFYGAREMGGICLASPVQIYLDLKGFQGRGEEAAVKLLDEVIRPQWFMEAGMPKLGVDLPMSAIAAFCGKWKITEFALFGSALRDDFDVASDIDLLVTFAPDVEWSLFDHVRMKAELEEILGRKVDLVNRRALEKSDNWIRRKLILETARVIHAA